MRFCRGAEAPGFLAFVLVLTGCTPTQPTRGYSTLPPRVSYVGANGEGSYYTGDRGICWGDVAPGGPRGNLCGASGARSH